MKECFWHCNPYTQSKICTPPSSIHIAYPNDIRYIDDNQGVHCIENMDFPTISLHCYAPPYKRSKCFDVATGTEFIGTCSFDSEYGIKKNPNLLHFSDMYGEIPKHDEEIAKNRESCPYTDMGQEHNPCGCRN